jgi:hypothetical protein
MSNSALEALQAANASYRKELELIDSVSTSAASRCTPDSVSTSAASRCTPRFAQNAAAIDLTYLARHVPV